MFVLESGEGDECLAYKAQLPFRGTGAVPDI